MGITLVGEVANDCDDGADFPTGSISADDDFVQGTGAVGLKLSGAPATGDVTATTLTSTYDFSSAGTHDGDHIIMWYNVRIPFNSTTGMQIFVGNGTDSGVWTVMPTVFYKGGFITKVINPLLDFASATNWTTNGNPAQLDDISVMGCQFTVLVSIMGNFLTVQVDQMTVGTGIRADAGSVPTPNTWEDVRAADEDTGFWGWWSSSNGAFIGKGKLFIGPVSGSVTSVFTDTAFSVIFADELVLRGFYDIEMRGAGTDVTWELASISAANPANDTSRWSITVDADTNSFADTNGVYKGSDIITLNGNTTMTGTTFVDGNSLIQNGAILDSITVLDPNVLTAVAYITSDDPGLIDDSTFVSNGVGHAIEIDTAGTYGMSGNVYTGYSASQENDNSSIYNNSGGLVTLNISNGLSPTVKNGTSATTDVIQSVDINFHVDDTDGNNVQFAQVYIQKATPTAQLSGAGNTAGDADLVVSSSVDTDIPTDGWAIVYDKSENATQPYRVASISGSTLTLAGVAGSATSAGTSTTLNDDTFFPGLFEGETIRNTSDGSWAVVDQIVGGDPAAATSIITSPLRGGTLNTWGNTDVWSTGTLATTLAQNVDTVDLPIVNGQTDVDGDITSASINFGSTFSAVVRIRSNEGATKYIPFLTTISITGAFSGSAVIQEDPVAI